MPAAMRAEVSTSASIQKAFTGRIEACDLPPRKNGAAAYSAGATDTRTRSLSPGS
jgi:hypothetical protein